MKREDKIQPEKDFFLIQTFSYLAFKSDIRANLTNANIANNNRAAIYIYSLAYLGLNVFVATERVHSLSFYLENLSFSMAQSSKNEDYWIENLQTIKKFKKTKKRACQCEADLYNAPSLTRERSQVLFDWAPRFRR